MNEAFLRQRRNVFVVCTILLALCLGGVDLEELTFAGMKFKAFKNPEVFLYGVWIAFGYFAYRFIVHFRGYSPGELRGVLNQELDLAVSPRIRAAVLREHPTCRDDFNRAYWAVRGWGGIYRGSKPLPPEERNSDPGLRARNSIQFEARIPKNTILLGETLGFIRFAVLTPEPTEHLFPLLFAAATFIYCGLMADWKGNLLGILLGH